MVILVRLIGFVFVVWGLWSLLANIAQTYHQVDWIYFDLFFVSRIIPPLLAIIMGKIIWWFSRRIARVFFHGLPND